MPTRHCDGIICFGGEDWWYHNRGHYDFQIMRRMSHRTPVLFINSIGVRMPRLGEGSMFVKRVKRKLASLRRGLVEVEPGFWVMSPISVPGRLGQRLSKHLLKSQVRMAARRIGIKQPLLWVHCPPAADLVDQFDHQALVFQRTDRFEAFPEGNHDELLRQVTAMRERADLVVFCSHELLSQEGHLCRQAAFVDHGVDYHRFASAGEERGAEPGDLAGIAHPRVGFIGGIDDHTFDPALFLRVAKALPDVNFVLVGACSLPQDWCTLANVHMLGRKPYDEVAHYMASCDVLLMPWNGGEWIRACNPVKLKEYLATGRPIVSTPFPELDHYGGHVEIAADASTFGNKIRDLIENPGNMAKRRARVAEETWLAKARLLSDLLAHEGIQLSPGECDAEVHSAVEMPERSNA